MTIPNFKQPMYKYFFPHIKKYTILRNEDLTIIFNLLCISSSELKNIS